MSSEITVKKYIQFFRIFFLQFSFIFFVSGVGLGQTTEQAVSQTTADLVWIEHDQQFSILLHSRFKNNRWMPAERILRSDAKLNTPSIVRGNKNELWVFWSVLHGNKSDLYFSRKYAGKWSKATLIPTNMSFNGGSTVALDAQNNPWLFWVGNNGGDDDIYCSVWQTDGWKPPERVHKKNKTPDILPLAGIDRKGRIWVVWSGFNGVEYQRYFVRWLGNHWSVQTPLILDNSLYSLINRRLKDKISFLDTAAKHPSAYIDIQDGENRFRSFRLLLRERN